MSATPRIPPSPRAALAPAAARLLEELRKIRKDPADVEAIHDARVAARRLAAASEIWLETGKPREKLRGRLEKCVRRLGRVRNADVAAAFLAGGTDEESPARQALTKELRRESKSRRKKLAEWLTAGRVKRVKAALSKALSEARGDAEPPGPGALDRTLRAILRLPRRAAPMADPREAHELRREIRNLRYQQESIAPAYTEFDAEALRDVFMRLQDSAGGWHDRYQIDRLAAALQRRPKLRIAAGALRRRLAGEMRADTERFLEAMAELVRLKTVLLGKSRRRL
ncbi:MAG: CHAD domain-containing protein [Planctomycetota bacterium]